MTRRRIENCVDLADVLELVSCDCVTGVIRWRERPVTNWRIKAWNKRFAGKPILRSPGSARRQIPLTIGGIKYTVLVHRLIWAAHHGEWLPVDVEIDHRDRNPDNNGIANLRMADRFQNSRNRGLVASNTSGFKGVYWIPKLEKWLAGIGVDGAFVRLGLFCDRIQGAQAYDEAAVVYHGEFAVTNKTLGLLP